MDEATCTTEDCDRPRYARGFCHKHYDADRCKRLSAEISARRKAAYDPVKQSERHRADYARTAEERREYSRRYRQEHPEKARAHVDRWVELNHERKLAMDRDYRARDPEAEKVRSRRWYEANKDKSKEAWHRRRALKRGAHVTAVEFRAILAEHGMVCHICGDTIKSKVDLHFDHVIPLAAGGAHTPDNIRPSHAFCNLSKGARLTS